MNLDSAILTHLSQREIPEQGDLLRLLRADGFDLTVSTLSRHLKKLQVRKEAGRYQLRGPQRPGFWMPNGIEGLGLTEQPACTRVADGIRAAAD